MLATRRTEVDNFLVTYVANMLATCYEKVGDFPAAVCMLGIVCQFVRLSCRSLNFTSPSRSTSWQHVIDTLHDNLYMSRCGRLKVANFLVTCWRLPRNTCYEQVTKKLLSWNLTLNRHTDGSPALIEESSVTPISWRMCE